MHAAIACPLPMPPAAITGMLTALATAGTRTSVVVSSLPLCPPASKPSATSASTPAISAFLANFTLLTTCTTFMPCDFNLGVWVFGLPADVKTMGTLFRMIISMCFSIAG